MIKSENKQRITDALASLPSEMSKEILRIALGRSGGLSEIREISIRRDGRCSILHGRESIPLISRISSEEINQTTKKLAEGALYAQRDNIASGYITLRGGVRVGICGYAKYDGDKLVGVSEIRSLLFRIPGHSCEFSEGLYAAYLEGIGLGMLIYSAPGVGKTTALRALAGFIGGGIDSKRVAVIDERCEFDENDYSYCDIDILKGYKRRAGIEIATRTLAPEVIIIDEIGADDGTAILDVVRCGIPLIATAHAGSFDELLSKPSLKELIGIGAFTVFLGICRNECGYSLRVDRI